MQPAINPFTYGSPISDPKRFVGRQREIDQIFMRLRNPEFENSSIVGERRSGKTSLLNYIGHPSVVSACGLDPEKFLFVYLDLELITSDSTPSRLYQFMLRRISAKVKDEALRAELRKVSQAETIDTFDLDELFDSIEEAALHIVLLVDEFENIGNNANFGPDFYYGLRSLAIHHDLALVTASRQELAEISRSDAVRSSPFFNIFASIRLQPFSLDDIHSLLKVYMAEAPFQFDPADVKATIRLGGTLPFFTQMAFHFLYDDCATQLSGHKLVSGETAGAPSSGRVLSQAEGSGPALGLTKGQALSLTKGSGIALVEERFAEAASPHLEGYWQHSSHNEKVALTLLTLLTHHPQYRDAGKEYWTPDELVAWFANAGMVLGSLAGRSLVLRDDRRYALASTTLRQWITKELTKPGDGMARAESLPELEQLLAASLPGPMATRAIQWLRITNTQYRPLFAAWLSDHRTAESVLNLLSETSLPLQQLQGQGLTPPRRDEDRLLDQSVSEAERRRAGRLASMGGTVSIMFTDLESSTELLSSLGDTVAQNLLRTHNQIVREQVSSYGGVEVKSMGDGFMLVFSSARRALECAVAIQRSFHQYNTEHPGSRLNVRIGVNVGEAIKEEEDFFGTAVVVAARVAAQANGGQIYVSELFRRVVGSAGDFQFTDLGYRQLKGLPEEHRVFEVQWTSAAT